MGFLAIWIIVEQEAPGIIKKLLTMLRIDVTRAWADNWSSKLHIYGIMIAGIALVRVLRRIPNPKRGPGDFTLVLT